MAIIASTSGTQRELIPAGTYEARCYQMIHIGTVEEEIMGTKKSLNKVRIGWELPNELKVFREENGEQPLVIGKTFTLSLHEKANLRKMLESWRSKGFTEEEAKAFDITKLLGVPCLLNIIHKVSKSGKTFEEISSISPLHKSLTIPQQINPTTIWDYDNPNMELLESFPDFIKDDIKRSEEYRKLITPNEVQVNDNDTEDDLPF